MKKFIKYTFLFSIPVLIFLVSVELYCRTQTAFVFKKKHLDNNLNSKEVLFLGSSYTANGINPEFIKAPSSNLAFGGQPISIDYFLLDKYIDQINKLKTVVFEVSPHRFYGKLNPDDWNGHIYSILYGINYKTESFSVKNYSFALADIKYFSTAFVNNYNPTIHKDVLNKYGFVENDFNDKFSKLNNDSIKIVKAFKMNHKFTNQNNFKLNTDFLIKIIEKCKDKKVKVVFINTPFYATYNSKIPVQANRQVQNLITHFSKEYGIPYYDFSTSPRFILKDFKNDNHLNPIGAKKFSLIIDSLLTNQIDQ
jgi:hypothetical protein